VPAGVGDSQWSKPCLSRMTSDIPRTPPARISAFSLYTAGLELPVGADVPPPTRGHVSSRCPEAESGCERDRVPGRRLSTNAVSR